MTENTLNHAELIARARKAARAVYLATDEKVADDLSQIITGLADLAEKHAAERDALAAVTGRVKAIVHEALSEADDSGNGWDTEVSASALDEILSSVPATVLARRDHNKWQEGYDERTANMERWHEPSSTERMYWPDSENPYRIEQEAQ